MHQTAAVYVFGDPIRLPEMLDGHAPRLLVGDCVGTMLSPSSMIAIVETDREAN